GTSPAVSPRFAAPLKGPLIPAQASSFRSRPRDDVSPIRTPFLAKRFQVVLSQTARCHYGVSGYAVRKEKAGVCPLYPHKRTNGRPLAMSALCQKRTNALQQTATRPSLLRRWAAGPPRLLADKPHLTGRLSEYPTDYFVGIGIETSAVAEQNTLRLPRVD